MSTQGTSGNGPSKEIRQLSSQNEYVGTKTKAYEDKITSLFKSALDHMKEGNDRELKELLFSGAQSNVDVRKYAEEHEQLTTLVELEGRINQLLMEKSKVHAEGGTALMQAVKDEGIETLEEKLKDADIHKIDEGGATIMHWAAMRGTSDKAEVFQLLLNKESAKNQISARDKLGQTPLHYAALTGNEAFHMLLDHGADINAQDNKGRTPLYDATLALEGELLTNVVNLLIEAGADVNIPDKKGRTPLHFAAKEGNTEVVCMLLNAGAEVDKNETRSKFILNIAATYGSQEVMRRLGIEPENVEGNTDLHLAAIRGDKEALNKLLEAGAEINKKNKERNTALHLAAMHGNTEAVRLLLDAGIHVNALGNRSQTAHAFAHIGNHTEVVKLLEERGGKTFILR